MSQENVEWLGQVSEARARGDYPDRVYRSPEGMRELGVDALETWQEYCFDTEEWSTSVSTRS